MVLTQAPFTTAEDYQLYTAKPSDVTNKRENLSGPQPNGPMAPRKCCFMTDCNDFKLHEWNRDLWMESMNLWTNRESPAKNSMVIYH